MLSWVTNFFCPPTKGASYQQAESCFTADELEAIQQEHCVHVLSQYVQTVDDQHFLQWAGLQYAAPAIKKGLCNAVRRQSGDSATTVSLDAIIIAKARCEKMDRLTAEDFAYDILDVDARGNVPKSHLAAVVLGCLELAWHNALVEASSKSMATVDHSAAAAAIAEGACCYSGEGATALTRDGYAKLCKVSPALHASLSSLLCNIGKSANPKPQTPDPTHAPQQANTPTATTPAGSNARLVGMSAAAPGGSASSSNKGLGSSNSSRAGLSGLGGAGPGPGSAALAAAAAAAVPICPGRLLLPVLGWGLCNPQEGLLQPGWVWLLAAGLPPALRQDWRLLFNSGKHGMSFSTFMGRLGEASPTLLLVRDKGGAVFGGIAHEPWKKTGTFYGDYASSIFSLLPKACVYPASGINSNIQWCGVGFSQLPNGVGFGGQVGHFALSFDANFDTGMSRPSATYASPCLASGQVFQVDLVEVWLLQPPEEEQEEPGSNSSGSKGAGLSALDKAKEDRKILEWAGVGKNYSAGVRDEPLEED